MTYEDGTRVKLGDLVQIPVPAGLANARIVMLGDTLDHLDIDEDFRLWAVKEQLLANDAVVVEWVDGNPLAHDDPTLAPVGNYMFTRLFDCVRLPR